MSSRGSKIVLFVLIFLFLIVIPMIALMNMKPVVVMSKGNVAVVVDIKGEVPEYAPVFSPGLIFGRKRMTLTDMVSGLERAARDDRVKRVIIRIFPSTLGLAKCEELVEVIKLLRSRDKEV